MTFGVMVESDTMTDQIEEESEKGEKEEKEELPGHDPVLAEGDSPDFKWYIAKTLTGQENKVSKFLRENIINHKLTRYFSKILVPEEKVTSHLGGKKRTIRKKIFPSYVLIKMILNEQTWHLVKNTDKMAGFVGGDPKDPRPISEEEALYMTNQSRMGGRRSKTIVDFSEGDQVKVVDGPFATFVGTVETVNDKGKIKVNVSIFGRPTPVELEFSQVEKVS